MVPLGVSDAIEHDKGIGHGAHWISRLRPGQAREALRIAARGRPAGGEYRIALGSREGRRGRRQLLDPRFLRQPRRNAAGTGLHPRHHVLPHVGQRRRRRRLCASGPRRSDQWAFHGQRERQSAGGRRSRYPDSTIRLCNAGARWSGCRRPRGAVRPQQGRRGCDADRRARPDRLYDGRQPHRQHHRVRRPDPAVQPALEFRGSTTS